jgi:hypothetical protein
MMASKRGKKVLIVRTSGESEAATVSSVNDIRELLSATALDHDYFRDLGVFVYYDFGSASSVNVFPSFLMQGGYRGDVVIVGDLNKEFERTDRFQHLPEIWFADSLATLIAKANTDSRARRAVEAHLR